MADTETIEVVETEDAEITVDTELDVASIIGNIVTGQAEDTEDTADTETTGDEEGYVPPAALIELAKQLQYTPEEIAAIDEVEAMVIDKVARKESRLQQRRGKQALKTKEETDELVVDEYSSIDDDIAADDSDDDEFTEDDWFTDEGRAKINMILKAAKSGSQIQQNTDKQRLKAEVDTIFDDLDPEAFELFLPGESDLIEPGSLVDERRSKAVRMAKTIQAEAKSMGHDLTLAKAIEQSLSIIAPTETENAALNRANTGRKKRGSQRLGTPSTTKGKQKIRYDTPEEQAIADSIAELNSG